MKGHPDIAALATRQPTGSRSVKPRAWQEVSHPHADPPIKDIWLYPLHKNFRSILCR